MWFMVATCCPILMYRPALVQHTSYHRFATRSCSSSKFWVRASVTCARIAIKLFRRHRCMRGQIMPTL